MRNVVNAAPTAGEALEPATERDAPAVGTPVDFGFLAAQTFGDLDLEREVLALFVAQAARVVPSLPGLEPQAQTAAAHLLKGSARGIGAWSAAAVAERYEQASQRERATIQADLAAAFAAAETAIAERLGAA